MTSPSSTNLKDYDFSYLIPPKEVFDVHHDEYYIRHGEDSQTVRNIFGCESSYSQYERQKLKEFEEMISKEYIQLPPNWTTVNTMRFVYSSKFELEKCVENLKQYLKWLNRPDKDIIPPKSFEILKGDILYLSGRDKQYRPIITINLHKIDMKKINEEDFTEALSCLASILETYCFVPGTVENFVIIVETNNTKVWKLPVKILQKVIETLSIRFTSSLGKLYVMNPSHFIKGSWHVVQKMLHPDTIEKISMISKSDYKKLLDNIPIDQLEKRYGGTLAVSSLNWPPKNTLHKPPFRKINEDPKKEIEQENSEKIDKSSHSQTNLKSNKKEPSSSEKQIPESLSKNEPISLDIKSPKKRKKVDQEIELEIKPESLEYITKDNALEVTKTCPKSIEELDSRKAAINDYAQKHGCCGLHFKKPSKGCNIF